ncbi:MAG: hypothetical protein CYPHOPRED_002347 [Cyphobasidiales sp. Tagirdzhanova-0007]|nr:MAG: hypothetical protein CYPHOPRED_002347 [Cyphobasidiales sp. Tagirdzhanova-0007]
MTDAEKPDGLIRDFDLFNRYVRDALTLARVDAIGRVNASSQAWTALNYDIRATVLREFKKKKHPMLATQDCEDIWIVERAV